jgi:N-acetylneuraminate lyase
MNKFKGIFPALFTPFTENSEVNHSELRRLMEYNIEKGVDGFYVDGSSAEAFMLSMEERKAIIKTCAEYKDQCTLIAQVGCIATDHAVELGLFAKECGYSAISSVAPFYFKFTFDEIKSYYYDLADRVGLPILIYNIPAFSGVTFSVENLSEFLSDDRFIGVKHTSNDYFALRRFKTAFPDKILYNGYDETFLAGLSMGADGAIGSTYNFMADKFIKIYNLFNENNVQEAMKIQKEADMIIAELLKVGVMQGTKAALDGIGFNMGNPRKPFKPLDEKTKKEFLDKILPLL